MWMCAAFLDSRQKFKGANYQVAGFTEMILKISKRFAFRLQVYETWLARVIAPLD